MVGCDNQNITVKGYLYDISNYGFYPPLDDLDFAYSIYAYYSPMNISKLNENNLDFYITPNPSANTIAITFNTEFCNNFNLQIFDISGRIVLQKKDIIPEQCRFNLDISELKAGLYFVNIQSLNATNVKKLIVY